MNRAAMGFAIPDHAKKRDSGPWGWNRLEHRKARKPGSLFKQQLINRIGSAKAEAVLLQHRAHPRAAGALLPYPALPVVRLEG